MERLSTIGVGVGAARLWKHPSCRICGIARFDHSPEIKSDVCAHCAHAESNDNEEPDHDGPDRAA